MGVFFSTQNEQENTTCTIPTSDIVPQGKEKTINHSTLTTHRIRMDIRQPYFQESLTLQQELSDCFRRITVLENATPFTMQHTELTHSQFIYDIIAFLRRSLRSKGMSALKLSVTKDKRFEMGYKCSYITDRSECPLSIFQSMVEDMTQLFTNVSQEQLN